jgi:hypothetical protein
MTIQHLESSLVRDLVIVFQQIDEYRKMQKDDNGGNGQRKRKEKQSDEKDAL